MSQELINIGVADAKTGDTLFDAFTKVNNNTTELYALNPDSIILVNQSNVATVLASIDSTKEYAIDGIVDLTGLNLTIDPTSSGMTIVGFGANISKLICSDDNYTMFSSVNCGDFAQSRVTFSVTGASSSLYGLTSATGFSLFSVEDVIFDSLTSMGYLDCFFQGLESVTVRRGGTPQLELRGPWASGYLISTANVFSLTDGVYTLYKAGALFSMQSRFRTNASVNLPATTSFSDFSSANFPNPSTFQLDGMILTRNGVTDSSDTNITPNIASSNLSSDWADNIGISNTFIGGELDVTTEIATTIAVVDTFVDLAGTFTPAGLVHFDSPVNGQLRHLGASPIEYKVSGQYILDASANDEVSIKVVVFRSATTSFEDQKTVTRTINSLQGGRNVGYFTIDNNILLNQNDYVKLQVANDNVNDVTAELNSFHNVEAR